MQLLGCTEKMLFIKCFACDLRIMPELPGFRHRLVTNTILATIKRRGRRSHHRHASLSCGDAHHTPRRKAYMNERRRVPTKATKSCPNWRHQLIVLVVWCEETASKIAFVPCKELSPVVHVASCDSLRREHPASRPSLSPSRSLLPNR